MKETFTIGRNEHSNIVIKDTVVSHDHACIAGQKDDYWLADLNSTNGTFLNDRPVKGEILLKDGDIVKIGTVSFKFER
ncbi:FHA domain-containing protein [Propionispora vibrioides]|uniref:FHA domain-containing protein n=1 Tax=Propionispora vibrioides TaxID=112903 RepID=UPI0015A5590D|nr:FHA domain-containing protein [Propionispora vibrioides]